MGSMTDEEYTNKFLKLLMYVLDLKGEKAKVQQFSNSLALTFRDRIQYDEPRSLEEFIGKFNPCYEHSKCKNES